MITIQCGKTWLWLDSKGFIARITTDNKEQDYLPDKFNTPFVQVGVGERLLSPLSMTETDNQLIFTFDNLMELIIEYRVHNDYTTFCVNSLHKDFTVITFGAIPTSIKETIGDVIGVVYNDEFAIGVQALNAKTLPGFPKRYADQAVYASEKIMSPTSVGGDDYFCNTAYETEFGSILQLYCENRAIPRERIIGGFPTSVAPMTGEEADIIGAKFALFGCNRADILPVISKIEISEGLPHPMINGEWAKTSRAAMKSYLITEFGVDDVDTMLDYAIKGGFDRLYHSEPFSTWGHFDLREDYFPNGDASLKYICDKANAKGLTIGLHTLTSFTKTNDQYVTPIPDPRLAKVGSRMLASDISADSSDISVSDISLFSKPSNLQTVQIGDELIRYSYTETVDNTFLLKECTRGAFGTVATAHKACETIFRLFDHGYKVFFPNIELQDEYCDRLISLFNKTGAQMISFDGLEGCSFSGEDVYAINRFCSRCYDGWEVSPFNDASRLHHNLWHMNTRMNWGEPWGEKMRSGMIESRIKNQEFFHKNLFPRMLGWFLIRKADRKFEATTLDDIEWALSKAAGFDAGFALYSSPSSLNSLGNRDILLETIKNWETLRMADRFSDELKAKLKDQNSEWHLEKEGETYTLYSVDKSQTFHCDLLEMQPGQPGGADWTFYNQFEKQEFHCSVRIFGDGYAENIALTTKNGMLKFPARINGGEYLIYDGKTGRITDKNYNTIKEVQPIGSSIVSAGQQALAMYCDFGGNEGVEITVNMELLGNGIVIE